MLEVPISILPSAWMTLWDVAAERLEEGGPRQAWAGDGAPAGACRCAVVARVVRADAGSLFG